MGAPGNNEPKEDGERSGFEPRALFAVGGERARLYVSEQALRRAFDRVAKLDLPEDFNELLRRIDESGNC